MTKLNVMGFVIGMCMTSALLGQAPGDRGPSVSHSQPHNEFARLSEFRQNLSAAPDVWCESAAELNTKRDLARMNAALAREVVRLARERVSPAADTSVDQNSTKDPLRVSICSLIADRLKRWLQYLETTSHVSAAATRCELLRLQLEANLAHRRVENLRTEYTAELRSNSPSQALLFQRQIDLADSLLQYLELRLALGRQIALSGIEQGYDRLTEMQSQLAELRERVVVRGAFGEFTALLKECSRLREAAEKLATTSDEQLTRAAATDDDPCKQLLALTDQQLEANMPDLEGENDRPADAQSLLRQRWALLYENVLDLEEDRLGTNEEGPLMLRQVATLREMLETQLELADTPVMRIALLEHRVNQLARIEREALSRVQHGLTDRSVLREIQAEHLKMKALVIKSMQPTR